MRASDEGLKSETLRAALRLAISGKPGNLEDLLCRHGGGPDQRPNLRLAAALGAELAALSVSAARLLARFSSDDAAPDSPRVFLPMAAAHGWVAVLRTGRDVNEAWAALADLASDERSPVRVGTLHALASLALREGGALDLVTHALHWLSRDDLDQRTSTAALVIEVLGDRRVISALADQRELFDYLSRAISEITEAPRSAERLAGRRRLLMSLPPTLAAVVATLHSGNRGPNWMETLCASAVHPDVRKALSDSILRLQKTSLGKSTAVSQRLRQVLEGSAKPLRDPSRLRPGTGRGKASRPMR